MNIEVSQGCVKNERGAVNELKNQEIASNFS
jgi:hypothetical protein